ncbi:MAG: hypothetical protein ACKV2Q_36820 [Planctomycetaceae bacterium]
MFSVKPVNPQNVWACPRFFTAPSGAAAQTIIQVLNTMSTSVNVVLECIKATGHIVPAISGSFSVPPASTVQWVVADPAASHDGWLLLIADGPILPMGQVMLNYPDYRVVTMNFYPVVLDIGDQHRALREAVPFAQSNLKTRKERKRKS